MDLITNSYRPIEMYVIMEKSNVQFLDMMTLVLSELLSKNILAIDYQYIGNRVDAVNLKLGSGFKTYHSSPVDNMYLAQFEQNPNANIHFKRALLNSLEIGYDKISLLKLILNSTEIDQFTKYQNLLTFLGKIFLNKKGVLLRKQIDGEIKQLRDYLNSLLLDVKKNSTEILNLFGNRYYFFKDLKLYDLFGKNTNSILLDYKKAGYDIHHELNFEYLKDRLKLAHVELLKTEYAKDRYDDRTFYDECDFYD